MYLIKNVQQHIPSKQRSSIYLNCTNEIKKGELNSNFKSKLIVLATEEFQKDS